MIKATYKLKKRRSKSFRIFKEFDNHEMVIGITDDKTNLKGYITIHNTNLGPALGGTRLQTYRSEEAALRDSLNLSKAMTYKCALAGLPWGGGKAVIIASDIVDRDTVLKAYAKLVESLGGLFKTGTDVGIFDEDVKKMSKYTQHMLGVSVADRGGLSTSKMAALGVYYSIRASLAHINGSDSVKDQTIGVKGVGKLGGELVRLLREDGAKLVIADIDTKKTQKIIKKYPDIRDIHYTDIHKEALDVFSPCALGGELRPSVVKELKAKIVAGGANNQLLDDRVGDMLHNKNILFVPDYIANMGGLIYVADELEKDGFKKERVLKRVKGIQKTLEEVFNASKKSGSAPYRIADNIALKRINGNTKV